MRRETKTWICATLAFLAPAASFAQTYPQKPIQFVVPFPAAGAGDIFARTVGQKLSTALGQQVVVVNRPGANGIIGTDQVAKSPADGYTLLMGVTASLVLNPSLYSKLPQ